MVSRKLVIHNPAGLHLRPISVLCNRSIDFKSTVTIKIGDKSVNAKSVIGVLSACVKQGDEIELVCEGPDEAEAIEVLGGMIESGLGDEFIKK
jgi:phosphocarrier protein